MKFVTGLFIGLTLSACASSLVIPKLRNRSLAIHDSGRLYYRYCSKNNWFGNCKEYKVQYYDLSDPVTRASLKGFVCKDRNRRF